jgi:hypothetical protein
VAVWGVLQSNFRSINQAVHERVDAFDQHATARARALQVCFGGVARFASRHAIYAAACHVLLH